MTQSAPSAVAGDLDDLIACPKCDALYRAVAPETGQRVSCRRCHSVLIAPKRGALGRIVALAVTVMILMAGATFFPFLRLSAGGLSNATSVLDAALAFSGPRYLPLALGVAALIVAIPTIRVGLILYSLGPLAFGRPAAKGAEAAFRLSEDLRPWSMAEIFILGVAVALVKVVDLADVVVGPAFWMFAGLVVVFVFQDGLLCRWSAWRALERGAERR